jgi:hypothetical protein
MGKNSKSKRDAKRKAAAKASDQRNSAAVLESFAGDLAAFGLAPGLTGEDSSSLILMSKWDTLNPADGQCPRTGNHPPGRRLRVSRRGMRVGRPATDTNQMIGCGRLGL